MGYRDTLVYSGTVFARLLQVGLSLVALLLILGGLSAPVFMFAGVALFALVLFGFVGVIELLAVRPLKRRAA